MPCQCRHLILLSLLLLIPFLIRSQQRLPDTLILHFKLDSYRLLSAERARLQDALAGRGTDSLAVIGYTDKTGTVAYNQRLSERRAYAAADDAFRYLRRTGTPALSVQVIGGGIAPTPERTDSDNRRVEIVIYYQDGAGGVGSREAESTHHEDAGAPRDTIRRSRSVALTPRTPQPSADTLILVTPVPDTASGKGDSAQPSAIISLLHINFIVDTPVPTDTTQKILPKYVEQLRRFKDRRLEIDGYVNSIYPLRGPKDPLYILSVRRAKFVYDYLIKAGFDPARLTYKGMGNATPINPVPLTREEMNANMRVEIKVY